MKAERAHQLAQELQLLRSHQMTARFHGDSMLPFLRDGDRVRVGPVEWDDIRPGDLITYRHEDKYPTRRVVRKGASGLVLWCDNWPYLCFTVSREHVLGRAVARERDGVWLSRGDAEWSAAAKHGLARFRGLHARRVLGRLRATAGRLFRSRSRGSPPSFLT